MSIRMRTGEVLIVERRPPALVRNYLARIAAGVALAALVLFAVLALAVRQTAKPVNRLANAVRAFSLDGGSPPLPVTGPRELRDLSTAFNDMQQRIRALVEERTRVFGAIAHDLRTYLTRMRLRADFIEDGDQRRRAEIDIDEMSQILDDILLFSQ
ncbi:HAMP domain-containing protein, partial [Mycobacterium tuberculosis]